MRRMIMGAVLLVATMPVVGHPENMSPVDVYDIVFREDESRIRRGNAAHNIGVIRHVAMNLLKREKTKISYRKKRIRAALNDDFRDKLLIGR